MTMTTYYNFCKEILKTMNLFSSDVKCSSKQSVKLQKVYTESSTSKTKNVLSPLLYGFDSLVDLDMF